MKFYLSLSYMRWNCKYRVGFISKRRKKKVFGVLRKHLRDVLHGLAKQKESKIKEWHLQSARPVSLVVLIISLFGHHITMT